jgi:WD40 repeat protein
LPISAGGPRKSGYDLREIFLPQISEFTEQHHHTPGGITAFDLSPDGKTLAVELATDEPDETYTDWVAVWDVESKRLVATKEVEHDEPKQTLSFSFSRDAVRTKLPEPVPIFWQSKNIRFSPDGRKLLVLTGPSLVVLSFPELKVLYTFEDRVTEENIFTQMFIEGFAMAANRLAILEQISHNSDQCCALKVILADLDNGKVLGQWGRSGDMSQSIALSPDGKLLALTINPGWDGPKKIATGKYNVFIVKPETGETVRSINSGYAAGNAQFIGGGSRLMTVPTNNMMETSDSVQVWDVDSGKLEQKFSYAKYGLRGGVASSSDGKLLAMAAFWLNPTDVKLDRNSPRGGANLLLWTLTDGKLVYESKKLDQEYDMGGSPINMSWGFLQPPILVRMSAAGDRLAFGGQRISVTAVMQEHEPTARN